MVSKFLGVTKYLIKIKTNRVSVNPLGKISFTAIRQLIGEAVILDREF